MRLTFLSGDWVARLSTKEQSHLVYGYQLDLNSVTAQMLAQDKVAATTLLAEVGLPTVNHTLFMRPDQEGWVSENGVWSEIYQFAKKCNFRLVAKPNKGTRGNDVFFIHNPRELEAAVQQLWRDSRDLCLSKWEDIVTEYRLIMLDGEPLLVYAKEVPFLVADGEQSVAELFQDTPIPEGLSPEMVYPEGKKLHILQKSNLSGGAKPQILDADNPIFGKLRQMAEKAVETLQMRFASVDIIHTEEGEGELKVLELNSGLVGGAFIRALPEGYQIAKEVYRKVIRRMFV
ncbi:MAG: hypothetical protein AAF740_11945 [Bacteroidota bacterium]